MLEIGGHGPKGFISNLGCFMWFLCAVSIGGSLVYAMKYFTEWSEGMFPM
jgi:hypothetical protein